LDAFIIAIGFVLRIIAGAYAIAVTPTGWIIVTTFFLSLFLGFGKRRNEILQMEDNAAEHRQVLSKYNIALLDQIIVSTGTIAIISYALYTLDAGVVAKFGTDKLYYTIPFVAYGVFRYILVLFKGEKSDPTEIVTSDYEIILDVVLWLITAYAIVYFSGGQFR
jgi:decaprenyl-phosphate phosphoribosyltransferase